ncbi:protein sickie-like isoform X2 [Leptidea sinapis]|uniref:protein sickie-like isoform X2 n=1 Tax=Leptidea sinapis TaxID=189913 RepID=UPI00213D0328|nr:protein sickie-like isoform X2 [Leptidea sinapis]XP_050665286.1 protein sickie-like isoform X2 [Leptidea sinapis]XP_050665287.1 protein sickie-like isoform X2 [Leptidea sinapis]
MAVTTSQTYYGSPIHDGFATIRAPRSRIKIRSLVEPNNLSNLPQRHSEYFTLQRNGKNSFLKSSCGVQYVTNESDNLHKDKPTRISFTDPVYTHASPPSSKSTSPVKHGRENSHYDSINIKPRRRLKSLELSRDLAQEEDEKLNVVMVNNGDRHLYETSIASQDSAEQHSVRTDTTGSSVDYRKRNSDRDNCSESSSYFTDTDRPISSYSDNSTIPSTDTEDVLKDLPNKSRFHKSPQKYATLNMRRPKFLELKPAAVNENVSFGSLRGNKFEYHSEPNTPLTHDISELNDSSSIISDVRKIPKMPLQNRNLFRRSVSESNAFSKRLSYRHSFSSDIRPQLNKKPHKCCECITGIPANDDESDTAKSSRPLGTLYEAQDPKVGCQTILRAKPPVPWWELALKKSRYKSCPILEDAHVVSAFEQSLSNMTQRLQQLTATAERKDSELTDLRQTIELLRKQSIQAGLTTAHMQSMGIRTDGVNMSGQESTITTQQSSPQRIAQTGNGAITRHLSTDSVSSINSLSSGSSAPHDKKHKKKGWLRSSFTKAFSRNAKISKTAKHSSLGQLSSQDSSSGSHHYDDPHTIREGSNENSLEHSHEAIDNSKDKTTGPAAKSEEQTKEKPDQSGLVDELKRQLREKDLVLTDIRLEALSSAHQLESLKDTVIKMRNEMLNLKQNNERLQRLVTSRSLAGSQSSLGTGGSAVEDPRRFSLADQATMHQATLDMHSQPLELDFNCLTSTPPRDKKGSPKSTIMEPLYGNKTTCELNENNEAILGMNGANDIFTNGMNSGERLSGDYDINSVLPPPKSRELAIGESYSDIGVADSQGDTTDGKKIAIAVYLGQPETFQRYFEEVQDTITESERIFYAKQSASAYNNHFEKQPSFDSPRISQNHSPEIETQEYPHINKSNTNSLKSNKSTHSSSYKHVYNCDSTINCNEFTIAYTYISGKTTWQNLDYIVRKTFKDYLSRIDPGTNLGLNTDSITSYHLGEATRGPEIGFPELLPCGYIIGTVNTLYICLQGVGSLAFDSLIPKNIVYRYVSLLSEHRRVILCGPSGTGKSYLAAKLAEFYVQRTQRRGNPAEAVANFNVDRKSCNELRAYLANIAEQCGAAGEDAALPSVVVLDNLQHASALGDAFAGLLPPDNRNMPVIIGTMSQATCNTTNLQLHHNFRWLLTANHMEPVKGFLARYLRRKLFSLELRLGRREPALAAVLEWLPGVWSTLNAFLEAHSSSDVTVGPRLFLACPMDLEASQAWFADVWNYSIVPYAAEAVREGVALYGRRRHAALDPLQHVKSSYPWREPNHSHTLRPITVEDMNIEEGSQDPGANNNQDPLLNMLMRLQEAANYSGNQSQDSDNASMDSNLTHDSSMGNEL